MHLLHRAKTKLKKLLGREPLDTSVKLHTADWNTKFDVALRDGPVRLHYWPAYSNPYQSLFYGAATDRFSAVPSSIEKALEDLRSDKKGQVCFHLHWLNQLLGHRDPVTGRQIVESFLDQLDRFCSEGGIFVWTVHNLQEHSLDEGHFETETRRTIARLAKAIFVHGDAAKDAVANFLPEARAKFRVFPHGNYIGVYPDMIAPRAARETLSLSPKDIVFLNLGFVRKYKGLTELCAAVEGLDHAVVAVAGAVSEESQDDVEALFSASGQTRLYKGWVEPKDMQVYLNAADFVVLPYVASLTSGAALLALSFGVPVIAPEMGPFPELICDGQTGFLYDTSDPTALRAALSRAVGTSDADRVAMRVAAYEKASQMVWSPGRHALFQVLDEVEQATKAPT